MPVITPERAEMRLPGFCSCGLQMTAGQCRNCDVCQQQEYTCGDPNCAPGYKCEREPGKRIPTDRDYSFQKVWRQRILALFPNQQR